MAGLGVAVGGSAVWLGGGAAGRTGSVVGVVKRQRRGFGGGLRLAVVKVWGLKHARSERRPDRAMS